MIIMIIILLSSPDNDDDDDVKRVLSLLLMMLTNLRFVFFPDFQTLNCLFVCCFSFSFVFFMFWLAFCCNCKLLNTFCAITMINWSVFTQTNKQTKKKNSEKSRNMPSWWIWLWRFHMYRYWSEMWWCR